MTPVLFILTVNIAGLAVHCFFRFSSWSRHSTVVLFNHIRPLFALGRQTVICSYEFTGLKDKIIQVNYVLIAECLIKSKLWNLKAMSHECRINLRMRNECHFLASVEMRFMFILSFGRSSSSDVVVCTCYFSPLSTSFVSDTNDV